MIELKKGCTFDERTNTFQLRNTFFQLESTFFTFLFTYLKRKNSFFSVNLLFFSVQLLFFSIIIETQFFLNIILLFRIKCFNQFIEKRGIEVHWKKVFVRLKKIFAWQEVGLHHVFPDEKVNLKFLNTNYLAKKCSFKYMNSGTKKILIISIILFITNILWNSLFYFVISTLQIILFKEKMKKKNSSVKEQAQMSNYMLSYLTSLNLNFSNTEIYRIVYN